MQKLRIAVVLGTARIGRESEKVSKKILNMLEGREEFEVTFVDVRDFAFSATEPGFEESERAEPWRAIVRTSDGFLLIVPEYNRSFPGELKLLLDSESPKQYARKAVALVGVSNGDFGGARVVMSIMPVLSKLGLTNTNRPTLVPHVDVLFDEMGEVVEPKRGQFEEFVNSTLDSLAWYGRALKNAREETRSE